MIAITISDNTDATAACERIGEIKRRYKEYGVPDGICIRNDSLSETEFTSMVELVSKLWEHDIVLESDDIDCLSKSLTLTMGRRPVILGPVVDEKLCMLPRIFGCHIVISNESLEDMFDSVQFAVSLNVEDVILDPKISNMKECLEVVTDIHRLAKRIPEAKRPILIKAWSGEYAFSMVTTSMMNGVEYIIVDDLDKECCDVIGTLMKTVKG